MVKIDRIEHIVTIPEGVTASISEDGVVTIAGPKGSLSREFVSSRIDLLQDGNGVLVPTDARQMMPQQLQQQQQQMQQQQDRKSVV